MGSPLRFKLEDVSANNRLNHGLDVIARVSPNAYH